MTLAKYCRDDAGFSPPADAPSAEPGPLPDDETISRDGKPIAVIRRGIMPDGRTVHYRTPQPPSLFMPWVRQHPASDRLKPSAGSCHRRSVAITEAPATITAAVAE